MAIKKKPVSRLNSVKPSCQQGSHPLPGGAAEVSYKEQPERGGSKNEIIFITWP
jgi:hypothetical protein